MLRKQIHKLKNNSPVKHKVRVVVNALENLIFDLRTMMIDMHMLVTQIDSVSTKLDKQFGSRWRTDENENVSPGSYIVSDQNTCWAGRYRMSVRPISGNMLVNQSCLSTGDEISPHDCKHASEYPERLGDIVVITSYKNNINSNLQSKVNGATSNHCDTDSKSSFPQQTDSYDKYVNYISGEIERCPDSTDMITKADTNIASSTPDEYEITSKQMRLSPCTNSDYPIFEYEGSRDNTMLDNMCQIAVIEDNYSGVYEAVFEAELETHFDLSYSFDSSDSDSCSEHSYALCENTLCKFITRTPSEIDKDIQNWLSNTPIEAQKGTHIDNSQDLTLNQDWQNSANIESALYELSPFVQETGKSQLIEYQAVLAF